MVRIGIAGAGKIVPEFLKAAAQVPGLQVNAIYARREEARKPLAEAYHIAKHYGDYDEMLRDPDVDVVYVALLNHLHASFATRALEAGKHVILEKPFTVTMEETDALIALAERKGLVLFEAITNQYNPNFYAMKEMLPRVGNVRIVQINFSQYSSRYQQFLAGEVPPVFNPEFAGGALTDLGIYNLHLVVALFGSPENVQYYANVNRGVDTSGVAILEYPTFQCVCVNAKDSDAPCGISIQGDLGCLVSNDKPSILDEFSFHPLNGAPEQYSLTNGNHRLSYEMAAFVEHFEQNDSAFFAERLAHTRRTMEVLVQLYQMCRA